MKTLELFCGRKSFSKVFDKYGYETITTDIDPIFYPDIVGDILSLSIRGYEGNLGFSAL